MLQFATRYDFLQSKCNLNCIPSLFKSRNVSDCIVSVFLDTIPSGLGNRINSSIPAEQLNTCQDLDRYLSLFKTQVGDMERDARASINLYEILREPKSEPQAPRAMIQTQNTKKLHHTQVLEDDDSGTDAQEIDRSIHALSQAYVASNRDGNFKSRVRTQESKQVEERERPPGGCLNFVLGDCPLGADCRYAHVPEERMQKTWQWYVVILGRSKYAASTQKETMEIMFPKEIGKVSQGQTQNTYVSEGPDDLTA